MPQFIVVKNFEKFQHYRDRKPPWIKLYRDLLADDRLFDLSEADRYQLIGIFILASQHDNKVPNKPAWLRQQLSVTRPISLQRLIDTGWIEVVEQDASGVLAASIVLADCKQDASPRARAERREETERDREPLLAQLTTLSLGEFGQAKMTPEQLEKLKYRLNGKLDFYISKYDRWVNEAPNAKAGNIRRKDRHAYESILNWADTDGVPTSDSDQESHKMSATPRPVY